MKIKKLTKEQLPIVQELACKIWPVAYGGILSAAQLDYMLANFYSPTALYEQFETRGHLFYLALDERENPLGFVSYELNCKPNSTKIHKIYVLPELHGTGIGKQLFELVKTKAFENAQTAIFLNVNKHNTAALHFYAKRGFTKVKDEVIDIGCGYVMDDYVLQLQL